MRRIKEKPFIIYKGKKYVRGFGLMKYKGSAKKLADKIYEKKL